MSTQTFQRAADFLPTQRRERRVARRNQKRAGLQRCVASGKRRFRDHREAVVALQRAASQRRLAELEGVDTHRREVRTYECVVCRGWHLTSQPQRLAA